MKILVGYKRVVDYNVRIQVKPDGSGVVTMTHLGTVAARMMLGGDNRASAFSRLPMPTLPLYDGRPWFMPVVTGWYRLKDFASGWRVT